MQEGFSRLSSRIKMSLLLLFSCISENSHIARTFGVLGVLIHLSILTSEIDSVVGSLLIGAFFIWIGLAVSFTRVLDVGLIVAIAKSSLACLSFLAGLGISTVVYRLLFHRLRSFPGPLGARVSRFYTLWVTKRSGLRYHRELERLHAEFGDFVRTGPREVSVNRASAVRIIHGPQSKCSKGPWYSQVSDDPRKVSLLALRDHEIHRGRRRVWDKSLGPKALSSYQPQIQKKADTLIKKLHEQDSKPIDVTHWTQYYTFDVMGVIAFKKDFRQLEDGAEHYAITAMHAQLEEIGLLGAVPWLIHLLVRIPGLAGPYTVYRNYTIEQIEQRKAEWRQDTAKIPTDVVSWLLKAMDDGEPSAPVTDVSLYDEGNLVIAAGSDTTASTLAHVLYYLATYPKVYEMLQKTVDETQGVHDFAHPLPYIDAIINETLRLKPVVPSGQMRVTPPEGLFIDETWIPGNTIVVVPQWVLQRDARNFPRPLEFIPERWLDKELGLVLDDRAFFPFAIGHYACVGKQLAYLQMRMAIWSIAREFDISLAPGEDGKSFDEDTKDTFTLAVPPLHLIFSKREK
ncbi:hypothetical protein F1880_002809 [Penicillium rolfsii]|nr:hypothetical protein F1880_002809 [Penicillium rolfsii]